MKTKRNVFSSIFVFLISICFLYSAKAADLPVVEIVAFTPPSVGSFLAPIIEDQKTDIKNGIDIKWILKPASAYNTGYASGEFKVGSSAALLSEALRRDKGMKTVFLFNTFDYFGAVLARDPAIKKLKDLEGKKMAAVKSTTNYAMFMFFAKKEGVDLDKISIQSVGIPALATNLIAGRVDAVQLWEPAYTVIMYQHPGKFFPVLYAQKWKDYTGLANSPYLGVAAHEEWLKQNPQLAQKIYDAFKDAEQWLMQNKEKGASIIAKENKLPYEAVKDLIVNNDRLGLNVVPAEKIEKEIKEVFKAGVDSGYLDKMPSEAIIYKGLK